MRKEPEIRILVLHNEPSDFQEWLNQECSEHQIRWAVEGAQVDSALREFQPEAVLSIKHSDFPGEQHRPALHHPSVGWFHVGGSGTEHLGSWDPEKVRVTNSVGLLAPFHAERSLAGLLALSTGLVEQYRQQTRACWSPSRFESLQGKTMLIVGLGRTGVELARRARAFGVHLIGVRTSARPDPSVDEICSPAELADLWPRADILSLNLRASEKTRNLVNRKVLRSLPVGALLLNASRGSVLDQSALEESLNSGHLAGAWLDVFEEEPLPPSSLLWQLPNVLVSAHCADQVRDFPLRFARLFVENLRRLGQGEPLLNPVSPPAA